nr:HVO_2523 family zinc finger protein [Halorubrum sp. F4]
MSETRERTDETAGRGDEARGRSDDDHGGRPCPRCGEAMVHRHCKYVCPVHGVVYDCSDTFY